MSYTVSITRRAQKQLAKIAEPYRTNLKNAITQLADEPRGVNSIKMSGSIYWRLRAGTYRAVYEIRDEELFVEVIETGHRRDVYRQK